jgi:putative intracellular protease/amidase
VISGIASFLDHAPMGLLVATMLVVEPPLAVLHELGHAIAAATTRGMRTVVVRVGGAGPRRTFMFGGIRFELRPVMRPGSHDAVCVWNGPAGHLDRAIIAVAGPVASIAGGTAALLATEAVRPRSIVWYVICAIAIDAALTAAICLLPITLRDTNGVVLASDGAHILAALRRRPPPMRRFLTKPERPTGLRRYRSAFWLAGTIGGLIALGLVLQATR